MSQIREQFISRYTMLRVFGAEALAALSWTQCGPPGLGPLCTADARSRLCIQLYVPCAPCPCCMQMYHVACPMSTMVHAMHAHVLKVLALRYCHVGHSTHIPLTGSIPQPHPLSALCCCRHTSVARNPLQWIHPRCSPPEPTASCQLRSTGLCSSRF
jgi:hypothetical protein